jgi:hypothetical protein
VFALLGMVMIAWPPALTSGGAVRFPPKSSAPPAFQIPATSPSRLFVLRPAEQLTPKKQGYFLSLRVFRSLRNEAPGTFAVHSAQPLDYPEDVGRVSSKMGGLLLHRPGANENPGVASSLKVSDEDLGQ